MFKLTHTLPVNDGPISLTRDQLWKGLVLKAENPVQFVDAMSACAVIERGDDWILRNFTLRGEDMQERVTFEPQERVTFERTKSTSMGTILNEVVTLDDGTLGLRFTFELEADGIEPGSAEEEEYAERVAKSYFQAVGSTLDEIRRRVQAGELDAA